MDDPIRILVVDDHNMVRLGLKAYFDTLADIEVVGEAATGEEAVRLVAELAPDVVLMDLIMPGVDGVEATRRLIALDDRIEVVAFTAVPGNERDYERAGAIAHFRKDMFNALVAFVLGRAAATA